MRLARANRLGFAAAPGASALGTTVSGDAERRPAGRVVMKERVAVDRPYVTENDAERERLRSLVTGLSDKELSRPMPGGWTVAAVLAHIGFWDARAIFFLDKWGRGIGPSSVDYEPED